MQTRYYKYPRTPHLPWSPGVTKDDIALEVLDNFREQDVVVTEKLDGENTTMYSDHIHARSLDSKHHPSRNWVKQLHGQIAYSIPQGWRICGENVYAKHSIYYENLQSYFYVFSIWNEKNICLSWKETKEWAELLDLSIPQVFYEGIWQEQNICNIAIDEKNCEGYVVRVSKEFNYCDFAKNIAKWVRTDHVQTDQHWMHSSIVANKLQKSKGN